MYISEDCNWTPYGTDPKLDKRVDSKRATVRLEVAKQGYGLDKLINDEYMDIRYEVAKHGYGLDKLVNDIDSWVRCAVADHYYGLDKLINDKDWYVRMRVAELGYGLDQLVNDKRYEVRIAVAKQGYGLDILIDDEDSDVRVAVAEQGYGLDKLADDRSIEVRDALIKYLLDHNYTSLEHSSLEQWINQNPEKCVLSKNKAPLENITKNKAQIEKITKDFIYKIDESNKLEVQTQYDSIDEFFESGVEDDIKTNTLVICTVDTKTTLFKVEKIKVDEETTYKFIVEITNGNMICSIKTFLQSEELLTNVIQQTIDYLQDYPKFSKYIDELENYL